jgi:uncharacterized protein (TIGR00288 family)
MAEHESSLAVLVDFENMARPGAKGRGDFDIHLVLNRLAEKGRVIVKRAYADWSRYRDARHELQNAGLNLIEMPSAREGAKNRADIQMVVDAMEWAYSLSHVDTFVLVSGDSDFSPLVGKLRELNKRVIGVGNRESASDLLIANCDEFIFYDLLAARAGRGSGKRAGGGGTSVDPAELLQETLVALQREGVEWPLASVVKDSMRRKYPAFDESDHGYSTFSKMLEEVAAKGGLRLETDPRSGTYRVELAESLRTGPTPPVPVPTEEPAAQAPAERAAEEGSADGRRRRRRRRPGDAAPQDAMAAEIAEAAEVFEIIVTPGPEPELAGLPPIDEPISYEDMIMLGPELDAEVAPLVEASDLSAQAPGEADEGEGGARRGRRRRRRGGAETPGDAATPEAAPAAAAQAAEAEPAAGSRRRRRRTAAAPEAVAGPAEPAVTGPVADVVSEEVDAEVTALVEASDVPATEEAPATTGRRRVRRRSAAEPAVEEAAAPMGEAALAEAVIGAAEVADAVAAQEPVAEEKPKRRRTTRKKAEPAAEEAPAPEAAAQAAPAEEPVAEEKPKRRRTTRKKAEPAVEEAAAPMGEAALAEAVIGAAEVADAVAAQEPVAEEKPKRRRATRKKAEPAVEEAPAPEAAAQAAPADEPAAEEKPKRKRAPRKKAQPAAEETPTPEAASAAESAVEEKPKRKRAPRKKAEPAAAETPAPEAPEAAE